MFEKTRHIPDAKGELKKLDVVDYLSPKRLYYPVTNTRCASADLCVVENTDVKVGEVLGTRKGPFFVQPIHSTVSGKYIGKERHFDNSGKMVEYLVVENDGKNSLDPSIVERSDAEIDKLTKDQFVEILKDKALVGLGGGAFPTYIKFDTKEKIDVVIGNGVECEPYLVSDYDTMKHNTKEMLQGLVYSMKAVNASKGVIAIKSKYVEVGEIIEKCINEYFPNQGIEVKRIGNYYPQGWELEVIKNALGITIPQGKLLSEYGIINVNVVTLVSIYNAIKKNLPVLSRHFVLSGDGIKNMAFEVKLGTKVDELIAQAGGLIDDGKNKVLVIGGPMMGANTPSGNFVVSHTVTSLIVLNEEPINELPCLRCASCVYSCPADLSPVRIMNACKTKDKEQLVELNVKNCIECGMCSYTCPSKIHLTDFMRLAKRLVR